MKRLMSSSALAHVHPVHCSIRRLLSNHQTWSIAVALLSRTYHSHSVSSGSIHLSVLDRKKSKKRRRSLLFPHEERHIDRAAREAFTESLHDILKNKKMLGLIDRGDSYVSVRELVRDSIIVSKICTYINIVYLVELPTFSNVILRESPKGGERGWTAEV